MAKAPTPGLTKGQVAVLERILRAGYRFVTFERFARYLAVEKDGFVALLDTSECQVSILGQVGYRMGEGIAMFVERATGAAFIWKNESMAAIPELVERYERVKTELPRLLEVPLSGPGAQVS